MNVSGSGSGLTSMDNSQGAQLMTAALSKSLQKQEGQAALALINAAGSAGQAPAAPVSSTIGQNINIKV